MKTATGIFASRADAERALQQLREAGFAHGELSILAPEKSGNGGDRVPTTDGEQPGMGKAIGGVVGTALGASGGLPLGAALSAILLPGVGTVLAAGFITAAITGAVGAVGGAAVGGALENALTEGLPRDELYFYEDALKQGRTVLIIRTDDDARVETAKKILEEAGAESIDAARETWWIGLRDTEAAHYDPTGDFSRDEPNYRKGFEAALDQRNQGRSFDQAEHELAQRFPEIWQTREFRTGYERGQRHSAGGSITHDQSQHASR